MPLVLNENATINCPHAGSVTLAGKGNGKGKIDGSAVLTSVSIINAPVAGCGYSPPCTVVASAVPSTKATISASGVVHQTSAIVITNPSLGPLPGTIVSAGQTKWTVSS